MGVNLWGESPLYVNPVNMVNILTKILAEGKGGTVRDRLEEASGKAMGRRIPPQAGHIRPVSG